MKKAIIASILILTISQIVKPHPLNMTVTDINIKDNKVSIKIKLFIDDFQSVLTEFAKAPVDLINQPLSKSEGIIKKYISTRFVITIKGKDASMAYKRSYLSNDVIFLEYEIGVRNLKNLVSFNLKNVLLFDDFPEQKNIANVNYNGKLKVFNFENERQDNTKEIKLD